jgi:16S rRNA (adenine1518-N6/adenine1519-N6)-dimethyltransferase
MTSPHTLLRACNLRARKAFGQNFLKHPATAEQIVHLARVQESDVVLEIGAGLGAMTIAAARRARKVIAVEKDRSLVPLLHAELLAQGIDNVQLCQGDILKLAIAPLAAEHGGSLVVMGNLPYNISSQVVVQLIRERRCVKRAVLMFQKELADRLCAPPGNKTYGRLSVTLQYCAELTMLRTLKAEQFFPVPKVDSALLEIRFKSHIPCPVDDETLLARVVQAAFGRRRKTLRNALAGDLLSLDPSEAVTVLQACGIDPQRRAETLSVNEFVALTNHIAARSS